MWLYELETMRSSRSEKWHSMAQAKPSSSGTYRRNGYQKSPHTPKLWSKHHKNLNVHFLVDWLSHVRASHGSSNTSFCPKNTAGLWNWKSRAWYLSKGKPLLEDTCQIIKAPIMLKITVVGIDSFSSVTQLCLTLCNPLDHSTPGFPVHHWLPDFSQTHVHRVSDTILCRPLLLLASIFPNIRIFSSESVLHIRWPKYWSFSLSIIPSNKY